MMYDWHYACPFVCLFVQSLLVQIRATIMSDGLAQLDRNADSAYTEREAKESFARMVARHGWKS